MKLRKCEICESPTARSIHFGARACKACAAFFRRTVALNVVYECKEPTPCVIHYEKRMACKKCRYDKCIAAKMSRESRDNGVRDGGYSVAPESNDHSEDLYTPSPSTSQGAEVPRIPTYPAGVQKEDRRRVIEYYKRIEVDLNNRRRIMYTDTRMINVFNTVCECHYKLGENGRRICGMQRNLLIRCLNDLAMERSSNPEEWMGNIILFISCVFQQMLELVNSLLVITFFDILDYDHVVKDFFRCEGF
ncbi:zinc finger, C4 type [Oesophagostomum dentatum]|uniref:Zinc finger, C4 type n=1 Tax=Oesophagostomum dentatum TaxID=61180 RepID=A0A0B1ST96_OESDE|nr:zinc finger, C4 type [Oesophagostomum dentatum]